LLGPLRLASPLLLWLLLRALPRATLAPWLFLSAWLLLRLAALFLLVVLLRIRWHGHAEEQNERRGTDTSNYSHSHFSISSLAVVHVEHQLSDDMQSKTAFHVPWCRCRARLTGHEEQVCCHRLQIKSWPDVKRKLFRRN
ncbi:MAG: hypothetical protein ABI806_13695, partial [Candidatus Solibacter sp.]